MTARATELTSAHANRYTELDGLRAIAVLSVIGFHYFSRFIYVYPYGEAYAQIWRFGYLGVELFFIISGFVIFTTLRRRPSIPVFAVKRFTRLWPPMLVCSVFTYVVMTSVHNPFTELRSVQIIDFLPSWTFTKPSLWKWVSPDIGYIDDAYWSLFVEIRFYFWFAVIFLFWKEKAWVVFLFVCAGTTAAHILLIQHDAVTAYKIFNQIFFPKYIFLFCFGVIVSDLFNCKLQLLHISGIIYCISCSFIFFKSPENLILTGFLIAFSLLISKRKLLNFLNNPVLVRIGISSYSIYLLHQNIGVTFIVNDPNAGIARVVIAILGSIALGMIVHIAVERRSGALSEVLLRQFGLSERSIGN